MMRFHHMGVFVSDLDEAKKLWVDLLGFTVTHEATIPDGPKSRPGTRMPQETLDDIMGVSGARSRMALLTSPDGAMIELQQCENPKIAKTPPGMLRYGHTGFHELGFQVEDIDGWFAKVRAAGYETQTDYVWPWAGTGKSFLFYDADGNMIQFCEQKGTPSWRPAG